jgi:hypothetical protein
MFRRAKISETVGLDVVEMGPFTNGKINRQREIISPEDIQLERALHLLNKPL